MKQLSIVSQTVQPSPIREMFNRAQQMTDVISFAIGEPDFTTPPHIIDAAVEALRRGETHYTPNAGLLPLRQALSRELERTRGIDYNPDDQIIVTAGAMEGLLLSMMTLLDPGDELILPDPYWTNYPGQVQICSAVPRFVPVDEANHFQYSAESLASAITNRTKGILINSPANPTGGVADPGTLASIAKIAIEHDLYVLSDEVYTMLQYGTPASSIASVPHMAERTLVINSFSKTYAMTGWRVGYVAGPKAIISRMVKLQENVVACVNTAAQYGALAALEGPGEPVEDMVRIYAERRAYLCEAVQSIDGLSCVEPQGAFYLFINISQTGLTSESFANGLLNEEKVVVVPGRAFGSTSASYVRLSYATSMDQLREGMARIARYVKRLMEKQDCI